MSEHGRDEGARADCRLLVVIVNYRSPDATLDCLKSLAGEISTVPQTRVVLVENDSGDGSAAKLEQAIQAHGWTWVELLISDHNRGFSGGNNLGIARGEPAEFVLLLNNDTIVSPGCLRACLDVMAEHPGAGAMSCRVFNRDGTNQNVTRRFPTPVRASIAALGLIGKFPRLFGWADTEDEGWDRSRARDVDWLGGAFVFIRSAAFGGKVRLDEDFFFYGEDVVLSHVIKRAGWTRRYDPRTSIVHLGGASSDPSRLPANARSVHRWKARYLVQSKCYGEFAGRWLRSLDTAVVGARLAAAEFRKDPEPSLIEWLHGQLEMISASNRQ